MALVVSVIDGGSWVAVAAGGARLGWRVGTRVAVTRVTAAVGVAVAVPLAEMAMMTVAVGVGDGVPVNVATAVARVSAVGASDRAGAMQLVRSSARNRIRVCVQRIIVCVSWLSLIAGMGVVSVKAPDRLSVRTR